MRKMKKIIVLSLALFTLLFCDRQIHADLKFAAIYTSVGDMDSISGKYADIVVRIDAKRQFVFSRETSYLPYLKVGNKKWLVDEIVQRKGDGSQEKPDKYNKYSYVSIIRNTAKNILIQWRYIPDFNNPGFAGVVYEFYSITPEGIVTRVIKKGTSDLVDWNDPENQTIQVLKLTTKGIVQKSLKWPHLSRSPIPAEKGSSVKSAKGVLPVAWWKFDEGIKQRSYNQKDITIESIKGIACSIDGNISLWKAGISGTALAFDGYNSKVTMDEPYIPVIDGNLSLEAWIVLGAYPWKCAPVVDLTDTDNKGIYFGINDLGQLCFKISGKKSNYELISKNEINLYQWTHIAAVLNKLKNTVQIFINGEAVGKMSLQGQDIEIPKTDIVIGLNKKPENATQHVSRVYPPGVRTLKGNLARIYGIEGLLDEIKMYNVSLTQEQVQQLYEALKPTNENQNNPDLERRILPGEVNGENANHFGAYYTKLKYHELWDNLWRCSNYADVVVKFDKMPTSVIFWRGTNYGPGWVTENNRWMSDQSCETGSYYGCAEHMADKQNRYSHVRILENTDARVVIHWRYATTDIKYRLTNCRGWADEYFYIYPDGTGVRNVNYHNGHTGWQDVQFLAAPGSTPEDNIYLQALTVANLKGKVYKMDWTNGIPVNKLKDAVISIVNFKSEYKVFIIYPEDNKGIHAWGKRERATPETHFAGPWNHWPVSQMPNDGRFAMRSDRVTSSALGGADPYDKALYGFTDKDIATLLPLARFWNHPPKITEAKGIRMYAYDQSQKAFVMTAKSQKIIFTIDANDQSPVYNPAFVIHNWGDSKVVLKVNEKPVGPESDFRQGHVVRIDGTDLIIWLKINETRPVTLEISK